MKTCPKCRATYADDAQRACIYDESPLVSLPSTGTKGEIDSLIGMTVGDRYHILEKIGTGAMGAVYRAEQRGLARSVALKVLRRELVRDDDTLRFQREAKAMSLLTHPNTVRVFDYGEMQDGLVYLAMELLHGELLSTYVTRTGGLTIADSVRIVRQVLGSLAEAHQRGVVHRDIKPDNIYLAKVDGQASPSVKVLDFGIAKLVHGDRTIDPLETQAGTVFGTPRYMSPEQAQGKPLDGRSDLYSVGIILYQLVVGKAPFIDDDAVVVMAKHIREVPLSPTEAAPGRGIPMRLERVIMRALEKDPDRRFRSAEELDQALDACAGDIEAIRDADPSTLRFRALSMLGATPRRVIIGAALGIAALAALVTFVIVRAALESSTPPLFASEPSSGSLTEPLRGNASAQAQSTAAVLLASDPAGAEVWRDGHRIGLAPITLEVPEGSGIAIEIRKAGFENATTTVMSTDGTRTVQLVPRVARPAPRAARNEGPAPANEAAPANAAGATRALPSTARPPDEPYERFD